MKLAFCIVLVGLFCGLAHSSNHRGAFSKMISTSGSNDKSVVIVDNFRSTIIKLLPQEQIFEQIAIYCKDKTTYQTVYSSIFMGAKDKIISNFMSEVDKKIDDEEKENFKSFISIHYDHTLQMFTKLLNSINCDQFDKNKTATLENIVTEILLETSETIKSSVEKLLK
jgi:hypothetical protein